MSIVINIFVYYSLFGKLIGGPYSDTTLVKEYIRPKAGDQLLDIGCGRTSGILHYLPKNVEYTGFDASHQYIETAQKRYGNRATFICEQVNTTNLKEHSHFDIVLAIGVLHHLDDVEALQLFKIAHAALKNGGRLITMDGVFMEKQSPIARWIISKDRGQNVRTQEGYLELASQVFSNISTDIRHDMLRIPYTHFILECTKK
jgi:cyclopropane fatty-acyl-phospholipid synthase-like methyltransferase